MGGANPLQFCLSVSKAVIPDSKENQDHPSPISVLDPSFEEDDSLTSESSGKCT